MNTTAKDPLEPGSPAPAEAAAAPKASPPQARRAKRGLDDAGLHYVRLGAAALILVLLVVVVLNPSVTYGPVARVLVFLLASLMVAVLVASEATAKFQLKLPSFLFVTTGAAAVCFGGAFSLYALAKPDIQVGIYNIYDEDGSQLNLNWDGAYRLPLMGNTQPIHFRQGNVLIVVFPEQLARQELRVRKVFNGPEYVGTISYTRSDRYNLKLGTDLKREGGK